MGLGCTGIGLQRAHALSKNPSLAMTSVTYCTQGDEAVPVQAPSRWQRWQSAKEGRPSGGLGLRVKGLGFRNSKGWHHSLSEAGFYTLKALCASP